MGLNHIRTVTLNRLFRVREPLHGYENELKARSITSLLAINLIHLHYKQVTSSFTFHN